MSYSSKLITLRSLILQLRALIDNLESPDLTIMDYCSLTDILETVSRLQKVIDEKKIVLELEEDEEGSYVGYSLLVADRTDQKIGLTLEEIHSLAPELEAHEAFNKWLEGGFDGTPHLAKLTAKPCVYHAWNRGRLEEICKFGGTES